VIGIITDVYELEEIYHKKNDNFSKKRNVYIVDTINNSIKCTLWGAQVLVI